MPNVGTITGSMVLDPSAYISGLNQAANATRAYQTGINTVSFAGFNRGIFATTTLLYGMNRIMSSMSKGMEDYSNMLGRIGSVADMTAASIGTLAESIKSLSVAQGVSRRDIMGGMYVAAQSGFLSPAEMRAMATAGAKLSRASGKEINVNKSVDLLSVARQALGETADQGGGVTPLTVTDVTGGLVHTILLNGLQTGPAAAARSAVDPSGRRAAAGGSARGGGGVAERVGGSGLGGMTTRSKAEAERAALRPMR